jgi:hypothetical protein
VTHWYPARGLDARTTAAAHEDERAAAVCDALDTTEDLFLGNQLILAALQVRGRETLQVVATLRESCPTSL